MKKTIFIILTGMAVISCRNHDNATIRHEKKFRREAVAAAEDFAKSQLKNPARSVSGQDIIMLSDSLSKYLIDPSKIVTGDFEGDTLTDAIIPLYLFRGKDEDITINLFLVNIEGRLMTVRALENDMKVLSILNKTIYIEMPVKSPGEPRPGLTGKTEVVKYTFTGDSLRRDFSPTDTIR